MPFTKREYVDQVTVIPADNLNDIQDELLRVGGGLDGLPATEAPQMDGTAAVGSSSKLAREDHVHPSDTSRVPGTRKVNNKELSGDVTLGADDLQYNSSAQSHTSGSVGEALASQSRRIDDVTNTTHSLSGATVTLLDGVLGAPLKSCVATITPVQAGSGDPSPTNVRAITGWTAANLYREAAYNASANPFCTVQFGQTVYSGQYNYLTGLLTVNTMFVEFDGDTNINNFSSGASSSGDAYPYYAAFRVSDAVSNDYGKWRFSHGRCQDEAYSGIFRANRFSAANPYLRVVIGTDTQLSDVTDAKTYLATQKANGTPLQVVATLATPQTIQLTPQEVTLLANSNTIWADCGDVSIEYGGYIGALEDAIERSKTYCDAKIESKDMAYTYDEGITFTASATSSKRTGNVCTIAFQADVSSATLQSNNRLNLLKLTDTKNYPVSTVNFMCYGGDGNFYVGFLNRATATTAKRGLIEVMIPSDVTLSSIGSIYGHLTYVV